MGATTSKPSGMRTFTRQGRPLGWSPVRKRLPPRSISARSTPLSRKAATSSSATKPLAAPPTSMRAAGSCLITVAPSTSTLPAPTCESASVIRSSLGTLAACFQRKLTGPIVKSNEGSTALKAFMASTRRAVRSSTWTRSTVSFIREISLLGKLNDQRRW